MCCQDPPPPPDLSAQAEASEEIARINQQTAREQLQWAREQDAMNRETLNRVLDVQLPAMEDQARAAMEDRERYEQVFQPIEDTFIEDALTYDTPARRQEEAAKAIADVTSAFDAQRRNALSRLESYGVDPSQTRNAALDIGVRTQQAAETARQANQARGRVEATGRALRSDVVNLGRGSLSNVAQTYGQAVGAGSAAVGGANQTTGTSTAAMAMPGQYSNLALQGWNQSAGINNMGYGNQMAAWNARQGQTANNLMGLGQGIGLAATIRDGGPVDEAPVQAIPFTEDGPVDTGLGDGSGIDDSVPALVSDGEYVIPADVVRKKGEEFFDKLIEKYHTPAEVQEQRVG